MRLVEFMPMTYGFTRVAAVAAASLMVLLAGACSDGGAQRTQQAAPATATPRISTPVDSPSAEAPTQNLTRAVEFTRLVWEDNDYGQAGSMVADDSPAARYIVARTTLLEAQRADGQDTSDDRSYIIDADDRTGAISIESEEGDKYTWKDFSFDPAGKITAWTTSSGPVQKLVWTRETRDSGLGATARLKAAYRSTSGDMWAVVEWSTSRPVHLNNVAEYSAKGGYKVQSYEQSSVDDLDKGEKALAYYVFEGAKFGGKLRLPVTSGDFYKDTTLTLEIG